MIGILDYGMGNLRSVEKALSHIGARGKITDSLRGIDKLIIPGVGAFGAAMERIAPFKAEIVRMAKDGVPIFGICLGQQLLFERSEEHGEHEGLGLLGGSVVYLPKGPGLKVPHVGWNRLCYSRGDALAAGGVEGEQVYFVHSLVAVPSDPSDTLATTVHGIEFASAVHRGNIWGAQFHPEKSGAIGLRMLQRFVEC
jgi:glutamine amidotransferase